MIAPMPSAIRFHGPSALLELVPFLLRFRDEVVQGFRPEELVQIACTGYGTQGEAATEFCAERHSAVPRRDDQRARARGLPPRRRGARRRAGTRARTATGSGRRFRGVAAVAIEKGAERPASRAAT